MVGLSMRMLSLRFNKKCCRVKSDMLDLNKLEDSIKSYQFMVCGLK